MYVRQAYEMFHTPSVSGIQYVKDLDNSNIFIAGACTKGLQSPGIRVGWLGNRRSRAERNALRLQHLRGRHTGSAEQQIGAVIGRKRGTHTTRTRLVAMRSPSLHASAATSNPRRTQARASKLPAGSGRLQAPPDLPHRQGTPRRRLAHRLRARQHPRAAIPHLGPLWSRRGGRG